MNLARPQSLRLPLILLINLVVFGGLFSTCNSTSTVKPPTMVIKICVVDAARAKDFPDSACGTGTLSAVQSDAALQMQATDHSGHPLAHENLTLTIRGANAGSASVTTNSSGEATYSYAGNHLGNDTVTASAASGSNGTGRSGTVVIQWIPKQGMSRPIIWIHGIHEDATDFAHEIHGTPIPDESSRASQQTWTSLLGALTTTYDPSAIQAFCYLDDIAWTHSPSGCPYEGFSPPVCTSSSMCVSESSVDDNAVALAFLVQAMYTKYGHTVTLMAYSMGGAVVRTMLAGCLNSPSGEQSFCATSAHEVDHVFLLNAAQEGSWLLTTESISGFSESGLSYNAALPFSAVLPLVRSGLYASVKQQLGLDLTQQAITDLTPQSQNITAHNSVPPISGPGANFYTFYGDVQLGIQTQYLAYSLPPTTLLPLGDLVFLPQSDPATSTPMWGGAALCGTSIQDTCAPLSSGYHVSTDGWYHEWALTDQVTIPMNGLVPLLSAANIPSALQTALNSPVQHLNISQPATQDPGSPTQVKDITGLAGGPTTSMSTEIYLILVQDDGLE